MDCNSRILLSLAVFLAFVQTLHAITTEDYTAKIKSIRSQPEIQNFLREHQLFFAKNKELFKNSLNTFFEIATSKDASIVLTAVKKVLSSETGIRNVLAVGKLVRHCMANSDFFDMFISSKKILIDLLISHDGLDWIAAYDKFFNDIRESSHFRVFMTLIKEFRKELL